MNSNNEKCFAEDVDECHCEQVTKRNEHKYGKIMKTYAVSKFHFVQHRV